MEIKTRAMGTVSIEEKQIIRMDEGFFGFPESRKFALIDAEQRPFIWVQSLDDEGLAFLAVDPFLFCCDYEIDLNDSDVAALGIESPSDVLVFALVTIPQDGSRITMNLQGPLIINKKNNKAMQVIHPDPKWTTKHDIEPALAAMREGTC